ncbi:MAG: 2'-5' RNA ligase family protein [Bradymonadaceae bacterium]
MLAIAALLDAAHDEKVQGLWRDLEERFEVKIPYHDPLAHISFHVFEDLGVDLGRFQVDLREWVAHRPAFEVIVGGLGLFPGPRPVLYLPVVRGPVLNHFHQDMTDWLAQRGLEANGLYDPARWIPHITLALAEHCMASIPEMIQYLCHRPILWKVRLDRIAVISETRSAKPGLEVEIPLGAP